MFTNISDKNKILVSFPQLIVNNVTDSTEWLNVRPTLESAAGNPVGDITSYRFRCNQAKPGTGNRTVSAGSSLAFRPSPAISHGGPLQYYMAKVPDNANINTWEAEGDVWFKTGSLVPTGPDPLGVPYGDYEPYWPALSITSYFFGRRSW